MFRPCSHTRERSEVFMQFLVLVAAVLISIATALASAEAVLSLLFRLLSRLR